VRLSLPAWRQRPRAFYNDQVGIAASRGRFPCNAGPAFEKDLRSTTFPQVTAQMLLRFGVRLDVVSG
jgi:hypothetical protein